MSDVARVVDLDELLERVTQLVERPLLLTRSQAARLLNVDRHRVGELVAEGHLRTVRLGDGARMERIPREECERLVREGIKGKRRRQRVRVANDDLKEIDSWEP